MDTSTVVIVALIVAAVGVGVLLIIRNRRRAAALAARGWTSQSHPGLETVLDLQAPPFGMGYTREAKDMVAGKTASGLEFRSFRYEYHGAATGYRDRVAVVQLPFALPDTFIAADGHRSGVAGYEAAGNGVSVVSATPEFAAAVMGLLAGNPSMASDLSIDGNHLVATGAPKKIEELEVFLAGLDPVVGSLAGLSAFAVAPPVPRFGFFGRPDWQLVEEDYSLLGLYPYNPAGYAHHTEHVVRGSRDGIRMDAFLHTWKEDHTESYTDSEGHTQTRTVTEDKQEAICGFILPFALPRLSVGGAAGFGKRVKMESIDFNDACKVRADDPKFAMDVIHPRMMEWLMATRAPGFWIDGQLVFFPVGRHDLLNVGVCEDTLHAFLPRIPRFVWQDLGLTPPTNLIV